MCRSLVSTCGQLFKASIFSVLFRVNWTLSGLCSAAGTTRSLWWDPSLGIMWVSQRYTMEIFHFIKYFHRHPLKLISPVLLFSFLFLPPVFYTCGDPQLHRPLLFYTLPFHLGSCVTFFLNPFYVLRVCSVHCVLGNFFSFWPKLEGMRSKLTSSEVVD